MRTLCQNILRDATACRAVRRGRLLLLALVAAVLGQSTLACDSLTVIPKDVALSGKVPPQQVLAYGQIMIEGLPQTILNDSKIRLELENLTTHEKSGYTIEKDGVFTLPLSPGHYAMTSVWAAFRTIEPSKEATPLIFAVPPGSVVYLGTLLIRLPSVTADERGDIIVRDDFDTATRALAKRYAALVKNTPPLRGLMTSVPAKTLDGILVDAILGRRLVALMLFDNDSPYTVLTRAAAKEFGVEANAQSAGTTLVTYRGAILSAPMRLKSLGLGNVELQGVEVMVDVDGYFPVGILGKNVLRQLKFTVDPKTKQVQFSR